MFGLRVIILVLVCVRYYQSLFVFQEFYFFFIVKGKVLRKLMNIQGYDYRCLVSGKGKVCGDGC